MTVQAAIRWWPLVGLASMALLGLLVGTGSTTIDDWFIRFGRAHQSSYFLLAFTDARLVVALFAVAVLLAAYRRRWRLAAVAAATPVVAVLAVRVLKRLFDRRMVGALAYPSGHVTVTTVVLGMLVMVAGVAAWKIAVAVAVGFLGLLGQAFTFHYFTDTIGALLLGTSLVCLAATAARLDRCQPRCDLDHSNG